MEVRSLFLILFIVISAEAWMKIISSLFTGNFFHTYNSLTNGQVQITYRFFYGLLFGPKILRNGLDVKYTWLDIEKEKLIKYFHNNNIYATLEMFKTLDAFEVYLKDGDSSEFQKKKPKIVEESFFEELKKMNEKLEENNAREN